MDQVLYSVYYSNLLQCDRGLNCQWISAQESTTACLPLLLSGHSRCTFGTFLRSNTTRLFRAERHCLLAILFIRVQPSITELGSQLCTGLLIGMNFALCVRNSTRRGCRLSLPNWSLGL